MRHKWFIGVAVLVLLLIGGAVAAYAYDSSREDQIAKGVTVAGVDVSAMDAQEARRHIAARLKPALEQPVEVNFRRQRFTLSAEDAQVRADVAGMVDEALQESRDGNILSRVARDLTGEEERAQVAAQVSYSPQAVTRLVRRVKRRVDRPARDASVDFPSVETVKEQNGFKVDGAALRQRVEKALSVPAAERAVTTPARIIKPKVTQGELASKYPSLLVVDRSSFALRHYKDLKLQREYIVAIGAVGFDTPAGLYHIQNKAVNPAWSVPNSDWAGSLAGTVVPGGTAENPLKARWLGIYDGAGIHGTDQVGTLGTAASHGCVRMAIPDVIELYDQVPVGAPIYIA
jgi:lipoprotein-anchoring transpeptidase ErfK/SrfK